MRDIPTTATDVWSAAGTVGAAAIAFFAAIISMFAWQAARKSAQAAASLTDIERRRLHHDMTPQFQITCTPDDIADRATLNIRLIGPTALNELTVGIRVRNDKPRKAVVRGASEHEIEAQIWGPYRFVSGVDGEIEEGRATTPFRHIVGDGCTFALTQTLPPRWIQPGVWREMYDGQPIRLALRCTHPDYEPWTIHRDISVDTRT